MLTVQTTFKCWKCVPQNQIFCPMNLVKNCLPNWKWILKNKYFLRLKWTKCIFGHQHAKCLGTKQLHVPLMYVSNVHKIIVFFYWHPRVFPLEFVVWCRQEVTLSPRFDWMFFHEVHGLRKCCSSSTSLKSIQYLGLQHSIKGRYSTKI